MVFRKWMEEQKNNLPLKIYLPDENCLIEIVSYNSEGNSIDSIKHTINSNGAEVTNRDMRFTKYINSWATESAYNKWVKAKKGKFIYNIRTGKTRKTENCYDSCSLTGLTKNAWKKLKGNYILVQRNEIRDNINTSIKQEIINKLKEDGIVL